MGIIPDLLSVLPQDAGNSAYAVSAHGEVTHGRDSLKIIRQFTADCKEYSVAHTRDGGEIFPVIPFIACYGKNPPVSLRLTAPFNKGATAMRRRRIA